MKTKEPRPEDGGFINWLQTRLWKATGRRFQYRVTLTYQYNFTNCWTVTQLVGTSHPHVMGDDRRIKKFLFPRGIGKHPQMKGVPLRNGRLIVTDIRYVGWF